MAKAIFLENDKCENQNVRSYNECEYEVDDSIDCYLLPVEEYLRTRLGARAYRYNGWKIFRRTGSSSICGEECVVYKNNGEVLLAEPTVWKVIK